MRIYIESFGCSTNMADGEVLAGCLREAGYMFTDSMSEANIVIYNCCSVKGPTENRMIDLLQRVPSSKKLIVAGCLPVTSHERLQHSVRFDGVLGPAAGRQIIDVVKRVLAGEYVAALEDASRSKPLLGLPRLRKSNVVSLVPVGYGCLGACAYCCVVFARGRIRSYTIDEITEKVENDVSSGVQEFWLTAQDMACYGKDLSTNLAALLKAVCAVPGDFKVRVGMMTPNLALEILPELINSFKDAKVFKFLHLPVQSGDNDVLRNMNRCYTVEEFNKVVVAFREAFPDVTLATDVICGFPGETKQAFENTLGLLREVKPDIVNVSKFFARPRTAAAALKEGLVAQAEIKRRSAKAAGLARKLSLERNRRWVGKEGTILIDETGKLPCSWIGRNFAYKPVTLKSCSNLLGRSMQVKITEAFSTYLSGAIRE